MQALFTLTSSESKRLIAKAVAAMPEVQEAMNEGYLIIGRGSTNAYIAEELLERTIEKEKYVAGQVIRGVPCALMRGVRLQPVVFHRGNLLEVEPSSLLDKLGRGDILLKGANAIDHSGAIGVFMASPLGGTMGEFYLPMQARGSTIIYPVGLEKMIPSVEEAARMGGILTFERSIGVPVGMVCVADGIPYTELDALEELFGVDAVHFASGGYGGAEGCVTIAIEGDDVDVNDCVDFIEETIKGEPPLPAVKTPCGTCPVLCSFQGKDETDLPPYLRGE
ncbi:MAG: hypothetical protein M0Q23_04540 [Syntrophales bacterium]|jgi:hypothetical protein|nr:hypothetical protein [Syntrophales bacterium]MCK9527908.1 hypothetical protein [Syntrophales bacterium]MDX9921916.1 hypothetical protein [Syntrophales bacterium]